MEFGVSGPLAFVSHAEMLKSFQRACVRAQIPVRYGQGFNPRPKMSLPLPRTVGVESDGDLLFLGIESRGAGFESDRFIGKLSAQLPAGCDLHSARIVTKKSPPQPEAADYVFTLRSECFEPDMGDRINNLMKAEQLELDRRIDAKGRMRRVDVRPYLESIEVEGTAVVVRYSITPTGSIRVEEIMDLLQISADMLAAPVRRSGIQWSGYGLV